MLKDIIKIAFLCIVIGGASIPVSFTINSSPVIVWLGNALGSLLSAATVIYIGNRITNKSFKHKVSKWRLGKKIVTVYDEGEDNKKIQRARIIINKRGLRIFSFISPIFPGALIATITVFVLDLDLEIYKRWLFMGIFFASGLYVFGYWFVILN